ncbi:hypothetical protein [Nonomuraea sp. NPDC050643]|uniref:hypothetical protein n=1 Tax=Nonomuraea sp. NPDC050643 TaxID=3155660 RepID=UPI0033FB653B
MVLKFHRDALGACAAAAKSASGAFKGLTGPVPPDGAFGNVSAADGGGGPSGSAAMAAALADLVEVSGQVAKTLGGRLEAVERALDAVEETLTSADSGAVQR